CNWRGRLDEETALLPTNDFQIDDEDRIKHWNDKQRDGGCYRQPANLRIAERFPERTSMQGQWEQGQDCGSDRNEDRPYAQNARIDQRVTKGFAMFVPILDKVEQHNHVTHNDSDETRNTENDHESHRHIHDPDAPESAYRPEWNPREND